MMTFKAVKRTVISALFGLSMCIAPLLIAQFSGGNGTEQNPYIIENAEQLDQVRNHLSAHFKLNATIDLGTAPWNENKGWTPIGSSSVVFEGSLHGNGFSILNLFINRPNEAYIGLFGYLRDAKIRRLSLLDFAITGGYRTAALAGYIASSKLHEVTLAGHVSSKANEIGSLAGSATASSIYQVHSTSDIVGDKYVGGLIGNTGSCDIRHSSALGSIQGNSYLGGFSGYYNGSEASIADCISLVDVQAIGDNQRAVGGFIGYQQTGTLFHNICAGQLTTTAEKSGGFLGEHYSGVQVRCIWDTQKSGFSTSEGDEGGVIGYLTEQLKSQDKLNDFNFGQVWNFNGPQGFPAIQRTTNAVVEPTNLSSLDGNGTAESPFLLLKAEELLAIQNNPEAHYQLMNDLDMSQTISWNYGKGFEPIYPNQTNGRFKGVLNGNGFSIKKLNINRPSEGPVALFAYTLDATIRNLSLDDVMISGRNKVAGLIGEASNTVLENIQISGQVLALQANAGGIAANFSGGNVHSAHFAGYVYADNTSGGAFSYVGGESVLRKVFSKGGVYWHGYGIYDSSKGNRMGGLIGYYNGGAYHNISDSYSLADVHGRNELGGFIGHIQTGSVTRSYAAGEVKSETGIEVGGFVGVNDYGFAENCYWDMQTTTQSSSALSYGAKGLSTIEIQNAEFLKNWNFVSRWEIKNTGRYPTFKEQEISDYPSSTPLSQLQGSGTEASPYLIRSISDLLSINLALDSYFRITEDLDLSASESWDLGMGWLPLANADQPFTGTLDGGGHHIRGLFISRGHIPFQALIAKLSGGSVKNLSITDSNIDGDHHTATFVAEAQNASDLQHLQAFSQLTGSHTVGGIVGQLTGGELDYAAFTGSVQGLSQTGGLAGYSSGHIDQCNTLGSVEFSLFEAYSTYGTTFGGLVSSVNGSMIENTYTQATVSGKRRVGGLVGYIQTGSIYNSYASGKMDVAGAENFGGLIGENYVAKIYDSYWDVDRTGVSESPAGYGRSHAEMMATDRNYTYGSWNFTDVWAFDGDHLNDNLPYLKAHQIQMHTISIDAQEGGGQVNGSGTYRHGSTILLQAIPDEGNALEYWLEEGKVISTSPTLQISLVKDRHITAHFGVLTAIQEDENQQPQQLALSQNYPNPFNPTTNIIVELDSSRKLELVVYNIMGQKVQILASGVFNAGSHSFTFNGQGLNSGIYLYRLQTENISITRKMLLIK